MGLPLHLNKNEDPEHHRKLVRHLIMREGGFGLAIIAFLVIMALILALAMFPTIAPLATFVLFAYLAFFTLPMWLGLFEDDIEEETLRFDTQEDEAT